ncbi:hypothetical protein NA57DRAFT_38906 [Rhizodiscina lignyota]|uniref:Reverse transcriptase domain-containing protein n=1 Tax=Rhizodiscina lignyota TaxID=1504668 RepID=A0A9P4M611_9PEZI|nr:hypothetical protein NA57DRAFT_38906 [Rhizodiscina lignyota]
MAAADAVLSRTLRSITITKIAELEKARSSFATKKQLLFDKVDKCDTSEKRVEELLYGVEELLPKTGNVDVRAIHKFLDQSKHDSSFPKAHLNQYEARLRGALDKESQKLSLASLYSRLLTEWMDKSTSETDSSGHLSDAESNESFDMVDKKQKLHLEHLCTKFEDVVFSPLETDEAEIHAALLDLFTGQGKRGPDCSKDLEQLRKSMQRKGDIMRDIKSPFTTEQLKLCLSGTLQESLFNENKKRTIREFMDNEVVLEEIADVLNMRYNDIENWEWWAPQEGIYVYPRRDLNGKYRIWMDEDVLQAILIYYIGTEWCVSLKESLKRVASHWWSWDQPSKEDERLADRRRRRYKSSQDRCLIREKRDNYLDQFFLALLPGNFEPEDSYDEVEARKPGAGNVKQKLLRVAATEIFLEQKQRGKVAVICTDLKWFATALSHQTIITVMRFIGVPDFWITWFKKFLEAPLNTDLARGDHASGTKGPRIRKRGVPLAHSTEKLTGELVLFFLDFAVFRETGLLLHRLHDDLWVWGDPEKVAQAWRVIKDLAKILGLEFNLDKTGSVYLLSEGMAKDEAVAAALPKGPVSIGLLGLDPKSGKWEINQNVVSAHVQQLGKLLADSESILSWVHTWNSCIGRFFGNTFGHPAACFGREHVDNVLATYRSMQERLFHDQPEGKRDVASFLKDTIRTRFDHKVLDSFLWLPEDRGGLGMQNPFIRPLLMRSVLDASPDETYEAFLKEELSLYERQKARFLALGEKERIHRFKDITDEATDKQRLEPPHDFMSFDEFTAHRERDSLLLLDLYSKFTAEATETGLRLEGPKPCDVPKTRNVWKALETQSSEMTWTMQQYQVEVLRQVGVGQRLIPRGFLPLGVMKMMRERRVAWRMVL